MKSLTIKSLIALAAMTMAAGSAAAQAMKVEIPFSFRAGKTLMAPGTYRVVANTSSYHTPMIQVRHQDQGGGVLISATLRDAAKRWVAAGVPKVQFDCIDGRCSLAKVWSEGRDAMEITPGKRAMQDSASLSVITLSAIKVR